MYLIDNSSPFDPGARPSNSSEARILMCESNASGVMTSSAGLSCSATLSSPKRDNTIAERTVTDRKSFFMTQELCGGRRRACNSLTKQQPGTMPVRLGPAATEELLSFFRRTARRFLFLVAAFDADLFQERLNRLFAAEKLFDRHVDLAAIALRVNLVAQFHPGLFVLITARRLFENGRHVGGNRVGPGVTVITGIVPIHVAEIRDHRRARIDRQENFFENRVRNIHAIPFRAFRMRVMHCEVEGSEPKLPAIKNSGGRQLGVVHLLNDLGRDLFRRIAIIGGESIENFLVPHPILQHLRRRFDEITGDMCAGETAILRTRGDLVQAMP